MGNLDDKVKEAKKWFNSKTFIGSVLIAIPFVVRLINPELVMDASGAADQVFETAAGVAQHADAAWAELMDGFGKIMVLLGLRSAAGGAPIAKKIF